MTTTLQVGEVHGAVVSEFATVVYGQAALTLPVRQLENALRLMQQLLDAARGTTIATPPHSHADAAGHAATAPIPGAGTSPAAAPQAPAPQPSLPAAAPVRAARFKPPPPAPKPEKAPLDPNPDPATIRRGQLWRAVQEYLQAQPRARGFKAILDAVHMHTAADRADIALKVLLGRRCSKGDIIKTPAGRYNLPLPGSRQAKR